MSRCFLPRTHQGARLFPDDVPVDDLDEAAPTETTFSTPNLRGHRRARLTSAVQRLTQSLTPNKATSYSRIPDSDLHNSPRQNPLLRCLSTIKARREAHLTRSWRQQTGDDWVADSARHNWYLSSVYM